MIMVSSSHYDLTDLLWTFCFLPVLGSPLPSELWPNHTDFVECYVTAAVNPTHIWVQLLTPKSFKLEEINTELNDLYSNPHEVSEN